MSQHYFCTERGRPTVVPEEGVNQGFHPSHVTVTFVRAIYAICHCRQEHPAITMTQNAPLQSINIQGQQRWRSQRQFDCGQ